MKIAVIRNGRARPVAAWIMRLISSGVGISTPTFSFDLARLSRLIDTLSATFCATLPRRCASFSSDLRLVNTFFACARDRLASKSSRKA